MSVIAHLKELRRRLVTALVIISLGAILGYVGYDHILSFLKHPYCQIPYRHRFPGNDPTRCDLAISGPLDGFTLRLKVAFVAGAVLTFPFWIYQIWAFITPGLRRSERKNTIVFLAASVVLFCLGASLAYLVLTKGLQILISQAGNGVIAVLTASSYINFVTLMLVIFGAAFELPLLVVMANRAGVLPASILRKSQRLAIFLIFLFAAVATPSTDPFTMCAMAVPMCLLFEGSVLISTVHDRRKAARLELERQADHSDDSVPSSIDPIPARLDDIQPSWTEST